MSIITISRGSYSRGKEVGEKVAQELGYQWISRYILRKDDDERRKWGMQLYGRDTLDSRLYDLVVHIKTKKVDDAVGLILYAVRMSCFQTTPESQKILDDLTLAADLKAALIDEFPRSEVTAKDSSAFVKIEFPISQQEKAIDKTNRKNRAGC